MALTASLSTGLVKLTGYQGTASQTSRCANSRRTSVSVDIVSLGQSSSEEACLSARRRSEVSAGPRPEKGFFSSETIAVSSSLANHRKARVSRAGQKHLQHGCARGRSKWETFSVNFKFEDKLDEGDGRGRSFFRGRSLNPAKLRLSDLFTKDSCCRQCVLGASEDDKSRGLPLISRGIRNARHLVGTAASIGSAGQSGDIRLRAALEFLKSRNAPCCAIEKAFSSMVYMMKTLQSYALQMRSMLFYESNIQDMLAVAHTEMHSCFLWLFQQVFSCTPSLMISVMLLFADFTAFSARENMSSSEMAGFCQPSGPVTCLMKQGEELAASSSSSSNSSPFYTSPAAFHPSHSSASGPSLREHTLRAGFYTEGSSLMGGSGGMGGRTLRVGTSADGDDSSAGWRQRMITRSDTDAASQEAPSTSGAARGPYPSRPRKFADSHVGREPRTSSATMWSEEEQMQQQQNQQLQYQQQQKQQQQVPVQAIGEASLQDLLRRTVEEMELRAGEPVSHVMLDQETIRRLVSPVSVEMEPDNYVCFDRTELQYRSAIADDATNPMLLSNFAQFLYVVRRNNTGANYFFQRALAADANDSDILGRFASFLWLGQGDRPAAEVAYKAAMASDPSNPYHSGSYAHFLWHCGDDDAPCSF